MLQNNCKFCNNLPLGVMELPPEAIKDAEGVGQYSQVSFNRIYHLIVLTRS